MASDRETFTLKGVIAVYPKISKPDTFGPKADGKYKTDIKFADPKRAEAFKAALIKKAEELMPAPTKLVKGKQVKQKQTLKYPFKTHEESGEITFRLASKFQPTVFDAKNNSVPVEVLIGGGTEMNVVGAFNAYDGRLSLYLNSVQIIKLERYVPKAREDYDSPFENTEGFTFEGEEGAEGASDDTTSETSDGAADDSASGDEDNALEF